MIGPGGYTFSEEEEEEEEEAELEWHKAGVIHEKSNEWWNGVPGKVVAVETVDAFTLELDWYVELGMEGYMDIGRNAQHMMRLLSFCIKGHWKGNSTRDLFYYPPPQSGRGI